MVLTVWKWLASAGPGPHWKTWHHCAITVKSGQISSEKLHCKVCKVKLSHVIQGSQHGFALNFLIKAGTSKATHLEMLPKLSATCQQAWASEHQGPVHLIPSRDKQSKLHCVSIVYSLLQQWIFQALLSEWTGKLSPRLFGRFDRSKLQALQCMRWWLLYRQVVKVRNPGCTFFHFSKKIFDFDRQSEDCSKTGPHVHNSSPRRQPQEFVSP